MNNTTLQTDISKLVGLEALDPAEQDAFLAEVGEVVFESALLRLVAGLSDDQGVALDHYLEDEPSSDLLMRHLFEHYPQFETILKEEMEAFREEVVAVMPEMIDGETSSNTEDEVVHS